MKIVCLQENIKNEFNIAERISGNNQTLPILNNVLIKTEKGFLKVVATDLEMGVELLMPCKVEKEGSVIIPIKLILNFINNLPNTKLNIEELNGNLKIETDSLKTEIPVINNDEFPIIPKIKEASVININSLTLKLALEQVLNSISISDTKPEITGILFDFKKDVLNIVSTDGFRLSEKTIVNKDLYKIENSINFILPQKTAVELIRMIDSDVDIEIKLGDNQVSFLFNKVNLISRVIDGNYPNYKQIIPKEYKTKIILDKDDLISKVKLASIFSSNINDIKFIIDVKKNKFNITAKDNIKGNFESDIDFELMDGEDANIVFNWRYLLDGLSNIKGSSVSFEMGESSTSAVLKSNKEEDYIYIIMPIKK